MSEIKPLWLSHLCLTACLMWSILNCCSGRIHLLLDVAALEHTLLRTVILIRGVFQRWGVHAWAAARGAFFALCNRREILVLPTHSSIRASGASWDKVTPSEMSRVNPSFWVMFICSKIRIIYILDHYAGLYVLVILMAFVAAHRLFVVSFYCSNAVGVIENLHHRMLM